MKSRLTTVILLSVLLGILLTPVTMVSATKPIEMTVTVTPGDSVVVFDPLPSGILKVTFYTEQVWAGDWEGIAEQGGTGMIRPAGHGKPMIILDCFGVFTGTIQGKTGTVIYYMRNNIDSDGNYFSAIITILRGTGELENIRGHGTVGTVGADMICRIWVHFDPS